VRENFVFFNNLLKWSKGDAIEIFGGKRREFLNILVDDEFFYISKQTLN
jgi:hypothetical protein